MSKKKNKREFSVMLISPAVALELLAAHEPFKSQTRKVSRALVNRLAKDISDKKFKLTHHGILVCCNGKVIDGVHRLHAVLKAGKSIKQVVATGLPQYEDTYLNWQHHYTH